ncbi:uncharacterized protein JCM15063_000694 [Sporobolomyces koalae]|uniref:uncharacterized protein n=1 Tax=Sporobolomyces koalae TaxID=500713 RepID=UPI00317FEA07
MPGTTDQDKASSNNDSLTWSAALNLLERSTASAALSDFLSANIAQLQDPANAFPDSSTSKDVVKAASGSLSKFEESAAAEVGNRFSLARPVAETAVRVCARRGKQEGDRLSEDEWERITAWVFEERMSVIGVVSLLLRIYEDEGHPCHALAATHVPTVLAATFPATILRSLVARTTRTLPLPVRRSATLSRYWATQFVLEQKALLELLFLVYYSPSFRIEGSHIVDVMNTVIKTKWSSQQELSGFMDQEAQETLRECAQLATILAVEVLNLEDIMEQSDSPYPIPAPGEPALPSSSAFHPSHLAAINTAVVELVRLDSERASPILLGWAFVMSRVTSSLLDRGVPDDYHDFAQASLQVETGSGGIDSQQPLFQLYASHVLASSSKLFPSLLAILQSSLFGFSPASNSYTSSASSDPNTIGYLSVIRGLILTLPHLVRLSYMTEAQLSGLFEAFAAVYANPSSTILCVRFWQGVDREQIIPDASMNVEHSAQADAEKEIVELARSRFPVQFGPYIRLVRALAAGLVSHVDPSASSDLTEDEELAATCAQTAFAYLSTLPTLTHLLPAGPGSLPYESLSYPDPETGYSIRSTQPIQVAPSLSVRAGTMGRLVSPPGRKPLVVCWDVPGNWSAWQLIGDLIISYAGTSGSRKKRGDVFDNEMAGQSEHPVEWENEAERQDDLIQSLDLLRLVLKGDPSLGSTILEHISSDSTGSGSNPDLVEALFKLLDRSLSLSAIPIELVRSLVELIAALLPSYPGVVWTFLRGSPQLFQTPTSAKVNARFQGSTSHTSVLAAEKVTGRYSITLALLTLVHSLVLEAQVTSRVVTPEYRSVKHGVLVRALNWTKNEVWISHNTWSFSSLGQKFELAKKVVDIFALVVEEGELEPGVASGDFSAPVRVVTDAFLSNASSGGISHLAPILSTFTLGCSTVESLHRAGRYHDAMVLEDLVESNLRLTLQLVRLRSLVQHSTVSLLEKVILSHNSATSVSLPSSTSLGAHTSSRRPEVLEAILSFVISPLSTSIAVQAAKVATLICAVSASQAPSERAGLVALLGGSERARATVVALLAIVDDPGSALDLHIAVFDLISAIVDCQPGLAMLLVTGEQYPSFDLALTKADSADKGKAKIQSQALLGVSVAGLGTKPLGRTAYGIAVDSLESWRTSWTERPTVLAAMLRFLDFVWQHLADYGDSVDELRKNDVLWQKLVEIATEDIGPEPIEADEVEPYCHRLMAKSHAIRIITLDVEHALGRTGAKAQDAPSYKTFLASFRDPKRLLASLSCAIASSSDPELHNDVNELIRTSFSGIDLSSLRLPPPSHPLDRSRTCGPSYIYSLPLLRRSLDGFLAQQSTDDQETSMIGHDTFSEIVEQTARLNCNFSLLEAQMLGTKSWRQSLETLLPLLRSDKAVQVAVAQTVVSIAKDVAQEDRGGQVMQTLHVERLEILLSLVEIVYTSTGAEAKTALIELAEMVSLILTNASLDVIDSISRRTAPAFHSPLFRTAFFLVKQLDNLSKTSPQVFSGAEKSQLEQHVASILRVTLSALRELFSIARSDKVPEIEQDLALVIAVLSQILNSPFAPSSALWLAHCHSLDLFRVALAVFVPMDQSESGRPLYAQLVLDFCLLVANSSPQAAEQVALDGVMTALTNNALTETAESGAIPIFSSVDGSQTPQHRIWTSMLALVVSLVSALGESTRFVEQDVTGFVRLYSAQISRATSWTADSTITAAGLEELSLIVVLLHALSKLSSRGTSQSLARTVAIVFVEQCLYLLQHLVYILLHPNHLSSLIEGTSPEARALIEKEAAESDVAKKPVLQATTLAILQLARDMVGSLAEFADAWKMLTTESTEWKSESAVVLPTATVTATEKSSIGTLLDLVSFCTDVIEPSSSGSASLPTSTASSVFPSLPVFSTTLLEQTAKETMEAAALLAVTQVGLWGAIGSGPQAGQRGAAFSRTLNELVTDLAESIDKAVASDRSKGANVQDKGWILQLLKGKLAGWSQTSK